jgi:hypothetical protein
VASTRAVESEHYVKRKGEKMKLSAEAKVAAGVAAAFAALTLGAIAQEHNEGQSGGPNGYGPTNNSGVTTPKSQQGYNSSLSDRIKAAENGEKFYGEDEIATTPQKPPSPAINVIRL